MHCPAPACSRRRYQAKRRATSSSALEPVEAAVWHRPVRGRWICSCPRRAHVQTNPSWCVCVKQARASARALLGTGVCAKSSRHCGPCMMERVASSPPALGLDVTAPSRPWDRHSTPVHSARQYTTDRLPCPRNAAVREPATVPKEATVGHGMYLEPCRPGSYWSMSYETLVEHGF